MIRGLLRALARSGALRAFTLLLTWLVAIPAEAYDLSIASRSPRTAGGVSHSVDARSWGVEKGRELEGYRRGGGRACSVGLVPVVVGFVLFVYVPNPQTPFPREGRGEGGSGDGTRITAEHRSETFSPSARAVSLRLGTKTYDANGNVETATDFLNRTTTHSYDVNNRLLTKTLPGGAGTRTFTYTATGRRLTAVDPRGTTTYGYDSRDRLTSISQPGAGTLSYTYDGNGGRTSITAVAGGRTFAVSDGYDDASRLASLTTPVGAIGLGYDDVGNRSSLTHPNGATTNYVYNTLNRLTNLTTTSATATTIQGYTFTLGASGNRTQIAEAGGQTKTYTYDDLYRLTSENNVSATLVYGKTFGYDAVGNRETQTTTVGAIPAGTTNLTAGSEALTYDTRDRLLTQGANSYTYDANGNVLTKSGEAVYTWDVENRLTRVTMNDGRVIDHVYDVDGVRVKTITTTPGPTPSVVTTNYLVDTSGGLSHVVAEIDGANVAQVFYVRAGDELVALARPAGAGYTARFFHADGIGSIRKLTDETGTITDSYDYTAFGEQILHVGTDPQPYAFAGEPLDPNSGFQYHRARWMDPRVGRFAGMDPWAGNPFDPQTLHKYLYAAADPHNRVDPTGRESLPASLTALSGAITVALSNFGGQLAGAFRQGGPVLGQFFQSIGRFAQDKAVETLRAFAQANSGLVLEEAKRAGTRVIDIFVRFGNRSAYIEVKWGLPWRSGEALNRLAAQVEAMAVAAEGQIVLWTMRLPTPAQQRLVERALGENAKRVTFVHGFDGWVAWTRSFLGM